MKRPNAKRNIPFKPIQSWWQRAYLEGTGPLLPRRFVEEATANLSSLTNPA